MMNDYHAALTLAITTAQEAGAILRADFHRAGGPRAAPGDEKAAADDEAQVLVYERLTSAFPNWGFHAEESVTRSRISTESPALSWLVDPNDGTRAYLGGARGSAVSIALLCDGLPVLGVVYAFAAPDDDGDLMAWAEGCGPLTRNGQPVERSPWPSKLLPETVVLVSDRADKNAVANLNCVAPGRYIATPSIAYRLALVATGDADAGVSLNSPVGWDYAAGHALIRATGSAFVDEEGRPVTYTTNGRSRAQWCFGGASSVVEDLRRRPWENVFARPKTPAAPGPPVYDLSYLEPGRAIADAATLRRAQGCLLGQLTGDALGSQVEFMSAQRIRQKFPSGLRTLAPSSVWNTLAGQPTDDSELALALARSIVAGKGYDPESAAQAYVDWRRSGPFDVGGTIGRALGAVASADLAQRRAAEASSAGASRTSESNGALMRISPIAIWGQALPDGQLAEAARDDTRITHPHPVCQESSAVFVIAATRAIRTGSQAAEIYASTLAWAETNCRESSVLTALRQAADEPPPDFVTHQGWVLVALQNAFYRLLHTPRFEDGVVDSVMAGGDTDTNGAIAGAILGAVHGREAVPKQWRQMVLSCRPIKENPGVRQARPRRFWPVDALELAERLVLLSPK